MKPQTILTPSLNLVPAPLNVLRLILKEDHNGLSRYIKADLAEGWSTFGLQPFRWTMDQLHKDRENAGWLMYLTIHRSDSRLIGTCGFKGKPGAEGVVEIGYEIATAYRLKGLATESALGLVKHAFSFPEINTVIAHTLAEENESGSVLRKVGLEMVEEVHDPDEGAVWKWEVSRDRFAGIGSIAPKQHP